MLNIVKAQILLNMAGRVVRGPGRGRAKVLDYLRGAAHLGVSASNAYNYMSGSNSSAWDKIHYLGRRVYQAGQQAHLRAYNAQRERDKHTIATNFPKDYDRPLAPYVDPNPNKGFRHSITHPTVVGGYWNDSGNGTSHRWAPQHKSSRMRRRIIRRAPTRHHRMRTAIRRAPRRPTYRRMTRRFRR